MKKVSVFLSPFYFSPIVRELIEMKPLAGSKGRDGFWVFMLRWGLIDCDAQVGGVQMKHTCGSCNLSNWGFKKRK